MAAAGRATGGKGESAPARPFLGRVPIRDPALHADGRAETPDKGQLPRPIRRDCPLRVDEQGVYAAYSRDVPNITFKYGGAQSIPEPDGSFDVALMFKSLHHVPIEDMPKALREIHRVLKPGGWLYVSEPIFAGAFNDIIRYFHDEQAVREAAFASLVQAVDDQLFELTDEVFFNAHMGFKDFAEFEDQVIGATHTDHQLDDATYEAVKTAFERHLDSDGASFQAPMRVDVLRRRP